MAALRLALALMLLATALLAACAQPAASYPEKPVTMIVLDPAGGATDQAARPLVEAAKPYFPQPIAIVNRPGGGGTVAASEVVQAKPDGYTIGLQAVGAMALQPQRVALPYKTVADYRPVINLVYQPLVFAVRADAPWRTMAELLAYAKANPSKVRVGIPGVGTIAEIIVAQLRAQAGADLRQVPFTSAPETVTALLGGQMEAAIVGTPPLVGQVQAGRLRVLGVFEEQRDPVFPDAPTLRELGYDITLGGYFFIIAPKGTPDAVVQTLHDAFKRALESESFQKAAKASGFVVDYRGPADLTSRLERDYAVFGEMAKLLEQ